MKKNIAIKKITALALSVLFVGSAASCSLLSSVSSKDMAQVIANVDITKNEEFTSENGKYKNYASIVGNLNGKILKRDLIAYFMNVGSNYVNSYGYATTFNMLLDNLVNRKIMAEYAIAYYLEKEPTVYSVDGYNSYIQAEEAKITDKDEKALYEAHSEILTIKYFITNGGTDESEYNKAVYTLKKSVNDTLDSAEKSYITTKNVDNTSFGDSRTTPTGVGTADSDYYFVDTETEKYNIYTGHNTADSCADYEKLDGSTKITRRKAYDSFLSSLASNNLISKNEVADDFTTVDYYYVELAAQLEQALITKYSESLTATAESALNESIVKAKYDELYANQKAAFDKDPSAFETAIGSLADDNFVLYSPMNGFGFVYNILIPFSQTQNIALEEYTSGTKKYYEERATVLDEVKAKDLRASWFSNNKDNNNAFLATDIEKFGSGSDYLFFEKNLVNGGKDKKYQLINQYSGKYAYNGTVTKDDDGFDSFVPNKVSIDDFLTNEFEGFINYTVGSNVASGNKLAEYMNDFYDETTKKFDYSKFMYYEGKVDGVSAEKAANYFESTSLAYKAVSAVNELMFAYSTDTGCFNKYYGYSVSPISNSYVEEFKYAARYAVNKGAGTYVVCPSTYGWHIIYVSVAYSEGAVYDGIVWQDILDGKEEKDGKEKSFSYLYYQSLNKSTITYEENVVLGQYNNEDSVTRYKSRYQDLLDLDNR